MSMGWRRSGSRWVPAFAPGFRGVIISAGPGLGSQNNAKAMDTGPCFYPSCPGTSVALEGLRFDPDLMIRGCSLTLLTTHCHSSSHSHRACLWRACASTLTSSFGGSSWTRTGATSSRWTASGECDGCDFVSMKGSCAGQRRKGSELWLRGGVGRVHIVVGETQ